MRCSSPLRAPPSAAIIAEHLVEADLRCVLARNDAAHAIREQAQTGHLNPTGTPTATHPRGSTVVDGGGGYGHPGMMMEPGSH